MDKHFYGSYIFEKSSHWRSDALENMIKKYNEERDRKIAQEGSLLLYKSYFLQYNALLLNCEKQYLKFVNLDVYKIIEKIWADKGYCQFVIVMLVRAGVNLKLEIMWKLIINKKIEYLAL